MYRDNILPYAEETSDQFYCIQNLTYKQLFLIKALLKQASDGERESIKADIVRITYAIDHPVPLIKSENK